MNAEVDGRTAHGATGGVSLDRDGSPIVLIHGAGMDATVWQLQTRFLAHHGFRAVAVDLPGHGSSVGPALGSIEEMADWVAGFINAAGLAPAHLVGHSMGSFVALEFARRHVGLVASVTLCGTATSMPVHPALMRAAVDDLPTAAALMASWGHARPAHSGPHPTPGMWMLGAARALVESSGPGVLATDFAACAGYTGALDAAAAVSCPATVVIGAGDRMTPPKSGRALAAALENARIVELAGIGHSMMTEHPRAVCAAILDTTRGSVR